MKVEIFRCSHASPFLFPTAETKVLLGTAEIKLFSVHGSEIWCLDGLVADKLPNPLSANAGSGHLFSFQVLLWQSELLL